MKFLSAFLSIGLGLFYFPNLVKAQEIAVGTWRTHLSYQTAQHLTIADNKIYTASQNALFYYDKDDATLNKLSKLDGLSDVAISALAYHTPSQTLIVAYQNGNIDLLKNNEITNLPSIKNSTITGNKNTNHILLVSNTAYLSTAFGIVVLDLQKQEIVDTYQNLGLNGTNVEIFSTCIARDSIFAATSRGIQRASFSTNVNLKDFNNWRFFNPANGIPNAKISAVTSRNNQVYAAINNNGILKYNFLNNWTNISPYFGIFSSMSLTQGLISACTQGRIIQIDGNDATSNLTNSLIINPKEVLQDNSQKLWIADFQNGLVSDVGGGLKSYFPNGLARSELWKLFFYNQSLVALSGGTDVNNNPLDRNSGYYSFQQGIWTNYNAFDAFNSKIIPDVRDLVAAAFNPKNQTLYTASFKNGILAQKPDNSFEVINQNTANSPLRTTNGTEVRISGLTVSSKNDLWISNPNTQSTTVLHVLKSDNTWQSFPAINSASQNPQEILIDNNQVKWILLNPATGGGIWLLDEVQNKNRYLNTATENGALPSTQIYAIAKDKDGQIWMGTDMGVAVYFNPSRAFATDLKASVPVFENRPLLRSEKINAIAIDGGNRKWIATQSGAWLFNPDGSKLITRFTAENSPLLSNNVLDIKINGQTGEVFFATDQGLISFRADATENNTTGYENVKVFPNPVRPDFQGLVSISGLLANVEVKITDVSGKLIFQTRANGGTAVWNLQDYNGVKAKTGVYLVFTANNDGSESLVTKVAVIE